MNIKHVTAYYVDAQDGRPASEAPLRHGPALPSENLTVTAVDRRETPPLIIGTLPASEPLSPGMQLIDQGEHDALVADVETWRNANTERELDKRREGMVVSRFQARAILRKMGVRDQVDALVADPETDPLVVDAWNDAQEFRRTSPTIAMFAGELGLSDEQVDEMFEQAAQIEA